MDRYCAVCNEKLVPAPTYDGWMELSKNIGIHDRCLYHVLTLGKHQPVIMPLRDYYDLCNREAYIKKRFDAAVCVLKEMMDILNKDENYKEIFSKTIYEIDKFISGIDPFSGIYEEKKELERRLSYLESIIEDL